MVSVSDITSFCLQHISGTDGSQSYLFLTQFLCQTICTQRTPREPRRDTSNRRLNERGIYIRHGQESNSQPAPCQMRTDPTRPELRALWPSGIGSPSMIKKSRQGRRSWDVILVYDYII